MSFLTGVDGHGKLRIQGHDEVGCVFESLIPYNDALQAHVEEIGETAWLDEWKREMANEGIYINTISSIDLVCCCYPHHND